eukprot:6194979-Pleurochrysis_carterae.AAC.2
MASIIPVGRACGADLPCHALIQCMAARLKRVRLPRRPRRERYPGLSEGENLHEDSDSSNDLAVDLPRVSSRFIKRHSTLSPRELDPFAEFSNHHRHDGKMSAAGEKALLRARDSAHVRHWPHGAGSRAITQNLYQVDVDSAAASVGRRGLRLLSEPRSVQMRLQLPRKQLKKA